MGIKTSSLPGINIQWPWSQRIAEGAKTVETRYYQIPKKHIGQQLALIETPGPNGKFKARIIGTITFGSSFCYNTKSEFISDVSRHLVKPDDEGFTWKQTKKKWGWPILKVRLFSKPIQAPSPRGIVFCSRCDIPMRLLK